MMQDSTFQKLLANKLTLAGLMFIAIITCLALFAYLIIDDPSPGANEQNAEIAIKPAGFKTDILQIKTNFTSETSFLSGFIKGYAPQYRVYPIKSFVKESDAYRVVTHYDQEKRIPLSILYSAEVKSKIYWLGTDRYGRSILSRLILGIRISLLVGLLSVLISLTVGVTLGAVAGYFGGWVDSIIMYFINVMWSIPTLLLVFAIVLAFGRGLSIIFLAVGLTMWVDVARIVRGQVLQLKKEQFVIAAKSLGQKDLVIISRHILPNILGPILVISAANFATAILIEAGLSYLGFGVKPPTPSIGNMLNEHYGYAIAGKPLLAAVPALMIMLMVLAFNVVGNGLRDIFDVKSS